MSTSVMKILCRYQYDPLDRLTGLKPAEHVGTQRFYQNDELVNEIEGQVELTILRHEAQSLAQRLHIANVTETTLLATDQQRSVLQTLAGLDTQRMAYTAYGHRPAESGLSCLLGFNGERPDPETGHYLLGQGNRAFNPVLMRFNSPDELSPFGDGGINPYAYCGGDPVNRYDPSGNAFLPIWKLRTNRIAFPTALPTEQLTSLDLPTPPTASRSNQTTTSLLRELLTRDRSTSVTSSATPHEVGARLKKLPTEGPARGPYLPNTDHLPENKINRLLQGRARRANARLYDVVIDELLSSVSHDQILTNSTLDNNFETAKLELAELKQIKAPLNERNRASARVTSARTIAKSAFVRDNKKLIREIIKRRRR